LESLGSEDSFIPLKIGCLVFTGKFTEAIVLHETRKKNLLPEELTEAEFYLGIGEVRRSHYRSGSSYFARNLLRIKAIKNPWPETRFYAYQGAAFLNFFKGYFDRSLELAEKAFIASLEAEFDYGKILALDLLAHSHCQTGKIRQGLHEFDQGLEILNRLGNGGLKTALQISRLRYVSQFGITPHSTVSDLEEAILNLRPEETYSKAELQLELCRQYILRGKATEGLAVLEAASDEIYRHQNKRQSALFNHRFAHIQFLRGESHTALALIRASFPQLDPRVDQVLWKQFKGLEKKIMDSGQSPLDERIFSDRRNRQNLKGEDPLGDIFDEISSKGAKLVPRLMEKGFFGLIPEALGTKLQGQKIYLGPGPRGLIIISDADVLVVESGLTAPLKKLLRELANPEFQSKENLIRNVWGHNYDPSIHDNVLYSNIARLRSILRAQSNWIEWSENGYRLSPAVEILEDTHQLSRPTEKRIKKGKPSSLPVHTRLNFRQLKALDAADEGEVLQVSSHARTYGVTTMTACRDLTKLFELGLLMRTGRARGTKYLKPRDKVLDYRGKNSRLAEAHSTR